MSDTMPDKPRLILHVGGPKCGSSALQGALSAQPLLTSETDSDLAYVGVYSRGKRWRPLRGRALSIAAQRTVHGYVSWPNPGVGDDAEPVFAALDKVWRGAGRGPVPVLSNEGWIHQADSFAARLPHWFDADKNAPIEVLGFARPPLDWLNSAYWQWGVWSGRSFQGWLEATAMPYLLGSAFAAWMALPNTRLSLHLSSDVVDDFANAYGVPLQPAEARNSALPPAMVGFLMRNRRFRPSPHESATEFVFHRWCSVPDAPRLWALLPRHAQMVRAAVRAEVDTLFELLPVDQARALRQGDKRWFSNEGYGELLRAGPSRLDDAEQLAQLYQALCRGVRKAAEAVRERPPQMQPVLSTRASVHSWDVAVAGALGHLIRLDAAHRKARGRSFLRPVS